MLHKEVDLNRHNQFLLRFRNGLENEAEMADDEWEFIKSKISFRTADRSTFLLENGKTESSARFIMDGVVKIINFDLEPYVLDFRTEGDFLCDTRSLLKQLKSTFTFETITQCEWIQIDAAVFPELIKRNAGLKVSMLMKVAEYAQRAHKRAALIRNSSAEERYLKFCQSHPEVIKSAKISDIASYLSITPQSLSRIRKNLV